MELSACYELNFLWALLSTSMKYEDFYVSHIKKIVPIGGADLKKKTSSSKLFLLQRCVSLVEFPKVSYFEVQTLEAFKNLKA